MGCLYDFPSSWAWSWMVRDEPWQEREVGKEGRDHEVIYPHGGWCLSLPKGKHATVVPSLLLTHATK